MKTLAAILITLLVGCSSVSINRVTEEQWRNGYDVCMAVHDGMNAVPEGDGAVSMYVYCGRPENRIHYAETMSHIMASMNVVEKQLLELRDELKAGLKEGAE